MKRQLTGEQLIIDKLDKILRVLSLQVGIDKSITERARLLKDVGIDNKTIASVLNTTEATIRAVLSQSKKHEKRK